jgi:diphthamide synthase (EF-2-diphthine--ammonia ligase)
MTRIRQYDKIRLSTGLVGRIMEVLGGGEAYIVDVMGEDGEYETIDIKRGDIKSRFIEREEPVDVEN